jgi:hypothetical protein
MVCSLINKMSVSAMAQWLVDQTEYVCLRYIRRCMNDLMSVNAIIISILFEMTIAACKEQFPICLVLSRIQHVVAIEWQRSVNGFEWKGYHSSIVLIYRHTILNSTWSSPWRWTKLTVAIRRAPTACSKSTNEWVGSRDHNWKFQTTTYMLCVANSRPKDISK